MGRCRVDVDLSTLLALLETAADRINDLRIVLAEQFHLCVTAHWLHKSAVYITSM